MAGKRDNKRKFVTVAVAVALVVVMFLLWKFAAPPSAVGPVAQPSASYAPKGEVIPGFPKELILDEAAAIGASYSLSYSANLNQYTASYDSKLSMSGLYDTYKSYYEKNGWTIVNEIKTYPDSRGLYAVKSGYDSSATILDQGKSRLVIVNYLKK